MTHSSASSCCASHHHDHTEESKQPLIIDVHDEEDDLINWSDDDDNYNDTSSVMPLRAGKSKEKKKLTVAIVLCLFFFLLELIGGIYTDSLALTLDSFHMLTDLLSFLISLSAIYIGQWRPTRSYNFGYHRAEVLGAFISILLIYGVTIMLFQEAVERIQKPEPIKGVEMFIIAFIGVIFNIILGLTLHDFSHGHSHSHDHGHGHSHSHHSHHSHHGHHDNMNIRAAVIHLVGDLIASIGVLIAAALIMADELMYPELQSEYRQVRLADPICTFVFSVFVVITTVPLLKECVGILMEKSHLNDEELRKDLLGLPGVNAVKSLHSWQLSVNYPAVMVSIEAEPHQQLPSAETLSSHNNDDLVTSPESLRNPALPCCSKSAITLDTIDTFSNTTGHWINSNHHRLFTRRIKQMLYSKHRVLPTNCAVTIQYRQ